MSRKIRNLLLMAGLVVAGALFAASFLFPADSGTSPPPASPVPSPAPAPTGQGAPLREDVSESRMYAVSLPRLQGLPPNASPGTELELWVAWEPPITKAPRYQKLLEGVMLEEIVPPPIPEAPPTALLSVANESVADLLYADRFGSLSVVVVP